MEFNLAEKLAIVKAIDKVILADQKVAKGEMAYLGQLMKLLNFDSEFVEEARKFHMKQANLILEGLSEPKKHSLAIMLHEMAYANGYLGKKEIRVLFLCSKLWVSKLKRPETNYRSLIFQTCTLNPPGTLSIIKKKSIQKRRRKKERSKLNLILMEKMDLPLPPSGLMDFYRSGEIRWS